MRIGIDTNLLVRLSPEDSEKSGHRTLAESALAQLIMAGYHICVTAHSLFEYWAVATRPQDERGGLCMTSVEARARLDAFAQAYYVLPERPEVFPTWLDLCSRYAVRGRVTHDARLAATLIAYSVPEILTFDRGGFARYRELAVRTPQEVLAG